MSVTEKNRNPEKILESKEQKFTSLMNDNMDFAYNIARRFFDEKDDIQDAVQTAFIKAWKSFSNFTEKKSLFSTWYYSILRNVCIDRLRKGTELHKSNVKQLEYLISNDSADKVENRELHQQIILLAERLSGNQKETFLLRDVHGYAIKEVVRITGQSEGSIKTNLYLARKKMRIWIIEEHLI